MNVMSYNLDVFASASRNRSRSVLRLILRRPAHVRVTTALTSLRGIHPNVVKIGVFRYSFRNAENQEETHNLEPWEWLPAVRERRMVHVTVGMQIEAPGIGGLDASSAEGVLTVFLYD